MNSMFTIGLSFDRVMVLTFIMNLEAVIGLEVHAQLSSKTKLWCGCSNDDFDAAPNTLACPVCLGYPGALPVLNKTCLDLALQAALALECNISSFSQFDRKNYFYPDLPMGYQISQFDQPVAQKGQLKVNNPGNDSSFKVGITRLHLENDAGKLVHEGEWSYVDYNRSGSPLIEIVTDPDIKTPLQAKLFAEELQKILKTVGASEASMYKGQMRFDASISLRPEGDKKLYPRSEIKNLNSFRSLEAALNYEIKRQTQLWNAGNPPESEATMGWIEEKQQTRVLREKESSADYRYFPEPDLPPLELSAEHISYIRSSLPELPAAYRKRLQQDYQLTDQEVEIAVNQKDIGQLFEQVVVGTGDIKRSKSIVFSLVLGFLNEDALTFDECPLNLEYLVDLIKAVNDGKISYSIAKEVLQESYETGKNPLDIIADKGLEQMSDESELEAICKEVLGQNKAIVEDYLGGKERAFGALVGRVMAATKGQANPGVVTQLLKKLIQKE